MKKRFSLIIVFGIIISALFTSISAFAFDESNDAVSSQANEQSKLYKKKLGNMVIGKVTAIDGNNITIVKAQMPERTEITQTDGEMPKRPEMNREKLDREPPEDGERPELSEEELQNMKENKKNHKNEMDFTGEEVTITVEDESIIKLMEMKSKKNRDDLTSSKTDEREPGSIQDIEIGSIINILYSDENDDSEIKEIMLKKLNALIEDTTTTGAAI